MTAFLLNLIKSSVTKDLLWSVFKDVILETVMDIVTDFVKNTTNPYDDTLVANLKAYIEKTK